MAGFGEHITAMVRNHASGDDAAFYTVALQIAAREARSGHHVLAAGIKQAVDSSRNSTNLSNVTRLKTSVVTLEGLVEVVEPSYRLRDLIISQLLMNEVKQIITEQRQRKNLLEYGFYPAHRLLCEGPPGTGKTMTASVLAHELSLPLYVIRLDGLLSKYMGETSSKLRTIFDSILQNRGVYLFDEFDAIGSSRSSNDVGEARRILNTFLTLLEQDRSQSIIIAATNHKMILDKALFRRFDSVLKYDLPSARAARSVIKIRLGSLVDAKELVNLGEYTTGLSHAELLKAAESAAKSVLLRGDSTVLREDILSALDRRSTPGIDLRLGENGDELMLA